jgi:hypothetical protein
VSLPAGWETERYGRMINDYRLSVSKFLPGSGAEGWVWFVYKILDPRDVDGTHGGWQVLVSGVVQDGRTAMQDADLAHALLIRGWHVWRPVDDDGHFECRVCRVTMHQSKGALPDTPEACAKARIAACEVPSC